MKIFSVNIKKLLSAFACLMLCAYSFAQSNTLTVTNGGGDGDYALDEAVTISADAPTAGQHFVKWTTSDGGAFSDEYSPVTTYTMPGNAATVTATYSTYSALISTVKNKLTASDAAASDEFGYCVDLYGDTAVISAWRDDDYGSDSGSVYVFVKSAGTWSQQQKLTPDDGAAQDYFGKSVAIYENTIVIGASFDDDGGNNSGSVYVFTRTGVTWTQQAKLTASDAGNNDFFGTSVAISGNTIISGAPEKGAPGGSVYVFTGSGASWTEQAILTASDAKPNDAFGTSVSISGESIVVGAHGTGDGGKSSGSAYVFVGSGASWNQQAKLTASDSEAFDVFGSTVDISGDTVVAGARGDDDDGISSGSAYVFTRSGTTWNQQAKLTASDAAESDSFGQTVSVSGDSVLIGAYSNDDAGNNSGSAYLFLRNGTTWTEQSKITAVDAAESDSFGYSVAIHGQNAVVGSVYDTGGGSIYPYDFNPAHKLTVANGTGDGVYQAGTVVPIVSDTPPAFSNFINWTTPDGGTIADPNSQSTTYTMPANDAVVTSNIVIDSYTLTYNAGANGSVTGATPQDINHGSDGTLVTASPGEGYHFVDWSDGLLTPSRTDLNVSSNLTVTANFALNVYSLKYIPGNGGSLSGKYPQNVLHGNDASAVTAVPGVGYHFVDWSDGVLTAERTEMNVTSNLTVTADFAPDTYTLTYTAGPNGSITGTTSQVINHGSNGTEVTAVPAANHHFVDWSDGLTTASRTDLNVTSDLNVTANFEIDITYSVTYAGNGNDGGTVPVDSSNYVPNATVTVLGNSGSLTKTGSVFNGWNTSADGNGTPYAVDANFQISSDVTLYAQWTDNLYTVTYDGNGNTNGVIPTDSGSPYMYNTAVTVLGNTGTLVKTGAAFSGWNTAANGSGTAYVEGDTFNMPASNVTLYAQWNIPHSADVNGDWSISQSEVESFISSYNTNNNTVTAPNGNITAGRITMREVIRVIYLYNEAGAYTVAQGTVDGYDIVDNGRSGGTEPPEPPILGDPGGVNILVTNNADSGVGTLRNAIAFAADGDTLTIDTSIQTITLLQEIVIDKSITIDGQGAAIVSGGMQTRIFRIENNQKDINVTITNIGIADAKNSADEFGGAIYNNVQTLSLDTVLFDGNANTAVNGKGGAVYSSGTLNVENCVFQNNTASSDNDIYTE